MAMTEERLETERAEAEAAPENEAAREERRLQAIREGRGMFRGNGTTVEDFMRERREETEREEAKYEEYLRRKAAARER